MEWSKFFPAQSEPNLTEIAAFVHSPLWDELCAYMETAYSAAPIVAHSCCSMAPGWNVKYKKSGRSLCTLYPAEGSFTCLVIAGDKDLPELELLLSTCSPYTQELFQNTASSMGSRWLMLEITDADILSDAKELIRIRKNSR